MNGTQFKFVVLCGNIGTVHQGNNLMTANAVFNSYVKKSKANEGRAAGESVTLFHCGEPRREYVGAEEEG